MTSSLCIFCTVCRYSRCLSVRCRECRAPTCQQRLSLGSLEGMPRGLGEGVLCWESQGESDKQVPKETPALIAPSPWSALPLNHPPPLS